MRKIMVAVALAAMVGGAAHAQSKTCRGKVVLDGLYQTSVGGNKYDYFVHIRNAADTPMHWQLNFADMPRGVMFSAQIESKGNALPANGSLKIKFGSGTNGNINLQSLSVGYDIRGKNVTLANCYEEEAK